MKGKNLNLPRKLKKTVKKQERKYTKIKGTIRRSKI